METPTGKTDQIGRRRANANGLIVHGIITPVAATLPRGILQAKREDSKIYLVFEICTNGGREEEACVEGCGGRRAVERVDNAEFRVSGSAGSREPGDGVPSVRGMLGPASTVY